MKERKYRIIELHGEESDLLRAAERSEREMIERNKENSEGSLIDPFLTPETTAEEQLMKAKMDLERKYLRQYGPECECILVPEFSKVPADLPSTIEEATDVNMIQRQQPFAVSCFSPRTSCLPPISERYMVDGKFKPTDLNLERLFLERVPLRRVEHRIYMFNGQYWKILSTNDLRTAIMVFLGDVLGKRGDHKQLAAVESFVMAEPSIRVNSMTPFQHFICLENGILDLQTGTLMPHSPDYFLTWKLCADWDENVDCPLFNRFLATITGNEPILQQRILEVIGYILFAPGNAWKRFVVLQGQGDTGKSVLGRLLASFFEEDQVGSVDLFRFGDRFSLSSLMDKKLNLSMDLTDTALKEQAVAVLKQITGGDLIQIEEKYKPTYSARISCKFVFGTNHNLRLQASDAAFMHRVLLIPFRFPIPKQQQDPQLALKLSDEKSGILRLALSAYRMYMANGMIFSGEELYNTPIAQSGDQPESREDGVVAFAEECLIAGEGYVAIDFLYQQYISFCTREGYPAFINTQLFSRCLGDVINRRFPNVKRVKKREGSVTKNCVSGIQYIQ